MNDEYMRDIPIWNENEPTQNNQAFFVIEDHLIKVIIIIITITNMIIKTIIITITIII